MNLETLVKKYIEYSQNVEKFIEVVNKILKEVVKKEKIEIPYEITVMYVGDIKYSFVIQDDKRIEILDPINIMKHVHKCVTVQECLEKISFEIPTFEDILRKDAETASELRVLLLPAPLVIVDKHNSCVTGTWLVEYLRSIEKEDVKIPVVKLNIACSENPVLCLELFKYFDFPVLKLPKGYIYYLYQVYPYVMTGTVVTEHDVAKRFDKDPTTISKSIRYFLDKFRGTPAVFEILKELRERITPSIEVEVKPEAKAETKPMIEITVSEQGEVKLEKPEVEQPTPTVSTPSTPPSEEVIEQPTLQSTVEEVKEPSLIEESVSIFAEEEAKRKAEVIEEVKERETGFELAKKITEVIKAREVEVKPSVEEEKEVPSAEVEVKVPKKLTVDDVLREFIEGIPTEVVDVVNRYFDLARKTVADECSGMDIRKCVDSKLHERAGQVITLRTYLEQAKVPHAHDIAKLIVLALGPRKTSNLIEEVKDALNLGINVLDVLRDYSEEFEQILIPRVIKKAVISAIRSIVEYEKVEVPHEVTGNAIIRHWLRKLVEILDALYELRGKLNMRDLVTKLDEIVNEGYRTVFGRDLKSTTYETEVESE